MALLKFIYGMQHYKTIRLRVGSGSFDALVADTFWKRLIGLMFRDRLGRSECMLFVFNRAGRHGIWMRNMLFSIDIVWLDAERHVVDFVERAKPCKGLSGCTTYYPRMDDMFIIEFGSGTVSRSRIGIGDIARFRPDY